MDTRGKILTREQAAEALGRGRGTGARVVSGYFDPLLAQHARRLREIGDRLIVIVRTPPEPLMPERARAELVAALACVEFVIPESALPDVRLNGLIREESADLRRADEFAAHVRRRAG